MKRWEPMARPFLDVDRDRRRREELALLRDAILLAVVLFVVVTGSVVWLGEPPA